MDNAYIILIIVIILIIIFILYKRKHKESFANNLVVNGLYFDTTSQNYVILIHNTWVVLQDPALSNLYDKSTAITITLPPYYFPKAFNNAKFHLPSPSTQNMPSITMQQYDSSTHSATNSFYILTESGFNALNFRKTFTYPYLPTTAEIYTGPNIYTYPTETI